MSQLPHVVWITMESTRADHTSLGDPGRETTPNIQRIADESAGRWFSNCFSHGIWTRSSSASILTGTYPSRHGAGVHRDAIPGVLPTVAELLGEVGYRTVCFSPNAHLSSASGLDRGFDEFAWVGKSTLYETVGPRSLLRFVFNIRSHGGGFTTDTRKHGTDFLMTDAVKRRLKSLRSADEPLFLYLHYGGPHHPYHPPVRYFLDRMREFDISPQEASELALSHHANLHRHIANGCPFSPTEWDVLQALYDGEIEHTDSLVGELFDYLDELGLGDTIFVVTGDHGELFGEEGLLSHVVSVSGAVSHVPLVVHGLDGLPDESEELVQHIDVVRTILAEVGVDAVHLQGVDLREEHREFAIVQRGRDRCRRVLDRIREYNPDFDTSDIPDATVTALRTPEYVYKGWETGGALHALPDEETDVSQWFSDVASTLESELDGWLSTDGRPVAGDQSGSRMTRGMRAQLESLGYLVE